eukprot:Skav230931  [mRNA]  locus=scaffold2774:49397:50794:- [translate_table: standard]
MGASHSDVQPLSAAEAEEVKKALLEADQLLAKCQPGWEDPNFPPNQSTISHDFKALNAGKAKRFAELRWLRAEEALGTSALPMFPPQGPAAADVRQDCAATIWGLGKDF